MLNINVHLPYDLVMAQSFKVGLRCKSMAILLFRKNIDIFICYFNTVFNMNTKFGFTCYIRLCGHFPFFCCHFYKTKIKLINNMYSVASLNSDRMHTVYYKITPYSQVTTYVSISYELKPGQFQLVTYV